MSEFLISMKEFLITVFSVLIGFFLKLWDDSRKERDQFKNDLHGLYTELETNIIYLENVNQDTFRETPNKLSLQSLSLLSCVTAINGPVAKRLRKSCLSDLLQYKLLVQDFNNKVQNGQYLKISVLSGSNLTKDANHLKSKLYLLRQNLEEMVFPNARTLKQNKR